MLEMDRNAVVLYLASVKDLEVAKLMLAKRYNVEKENTVKKLKQLKLATNIPMATEYYNSGEKPVFVTSHGFGYLTIMILLLVFGLFDLIAIGIEYTNLSQDQSGVVPLGIIAGLTFTGFGCFMLMDLYKEWKVHQQRLKEWKYKSSPEFQKKYHEARVKENSKVPKRREVANRALKNYESEAQKRMNYLENEWSKLNSTLNAFYSMNLIPGPYRHKLWAIYWLHEWMSTTPDSLSAAYASLQREDIARRMEARLDRLISLTEENIRQNRVLESLVSSSVEQNKAMISSLQNTERNTSIAAQYAQLSSNYSKASAYFSLANYLRG